MKCTIDTFTGDTTCGRTDYIERITIAQLLSRLFIVEIRMDRGTRIIKIIQL